MTKQSPMSDTPATPTPPWGDGSLCYEQCGDKCNDIFIGIASRVSADGHVAAESESGCLDAMDAEGNEIEFYRESVAFIDDSCCDGFSPQACAEYLVTAANSHATLLHQRDALVKALEDVKIRAIRIREDNARVAAEASYIQRIATVAIASIKE